MTIVIGRHRLERCAPAVQSRLLLAAALTPLFLTTIIFTASVADWLLSGPADFCLKQSDSSHPSISLLLLFSFFFSRVAILGFRFATDVRRGPTLTALSKGHRPAPSPAVACCLLRSRRRSCWEC